MRSYRRPHPRNLPGNRAAQLLCFPAPSYLADMVPPFVRYWPRGNRPISTRRLGSHKTLLGFAFGIIVAVLTTWIQAQIGWPGGLVRYDGWLSLGLRSASVWARWVATA